VNRLIVPESVSTPADDTKKDIAVAVLQAFKLMDEIPEKSFRYHILRTRFVLQEKS